MRALPMARVLLDDRWVQPQSMQVATMQSEVIALLFPESGSVPEGPASFVTALMRDAQGIMELRRLRPDKSLIGKARVAGRFNCGKPIVDPVTREIMGYEIDPIVMPAA